MFRGCFSHTNHVAAERNPSCFFLFRPRVCPFERDFGATMNERWDRMALCPCGKSHPVTTHGSSGNFSSFHGSFFPITKTPGETNPCKVETTMADALASFQPTQRRNAKNVRFRSTMLFVVSFFAFCDSCMCWGKTRSQTCWLLTCSHRCGQLAARARPSTSTKHEMQT